jgi:hypothetical protein
MSSSSAASNETSATAMEGIQNFIYLTDDFDIPNKVITPKRDIMALGINEIMAMCDFIPGEYKIKSFLDADLMIGCFDKDLTLLGFVMAEDWRPTGENVLYISLICTNNDTKYSRIGTYLMTIVQELCAFNKIDTIKLNSVEGAIGFYTKLGFIPEADSRYMSYNVSKFVPPSKGGKRRRQRSSKPKKRSSKTRRHR